jgi:hypothetical protein
MRYSFVFGLGFFLRSIVNFALALSLLSSLSFASPGPQGDGLNMPRSAFKRCPGVSSVHALSSGQRVEFPICYEGARSIALEGTVDARLLDERLSSFGLYSVPFQEGRALVRWYFLEYDKTTLGPYRESFIGVVASKERKRSGMMQLLRMWSGMPGGPPSDVGIFEMNLWVDQTFALAVGNELLGTEKRMANITVDLRGGSPVSVEFDDGSGALGFGLKKGFEAFHKEVFGNNLDFFLLTRGRMGARTRFKGVSYKASWEKAGRSFAHPVLEALDFMPQAVIVAPRYDGLLYSPTLSY